MLITNFHSFKAKVQAQEQNLNPPEMWKMIQQKHRVSRDGPLSESVPCEINITAYNTIEWPFPVLVINGRGKRVCFPGSILGLPYLLLR